MHLLQFYTNNCNDHSAYTNNCNDHSAYTMPFFESAGLYHLYSLSQRQHGEQGQYMMSYLHTVPATGNVKMKRVLTRLRSPCPSNGGNSRALKA